MGTRAARMFTWVLPVAVLLSLVGAPSVAAAEAPMFTDPEFRDFYYAHLSHLPVTPLTSPPAIYGDGPADTRIRSLAEARGYRLQAVPATPLGSYGGMTLAGGAGDAWLRLRSAAQANGTPLQGNSGYRSVAQQRSIFIRLLESAGRARLGRPYTASEIARGEADGAIESVLRLNSIPGYSRHHTGHTIDVSHAGGTNATFSGTAAHRWLTADNYANAKRFGFIPNYPPGAGSQGPNPEPWEFSFQGVEAIRCAARYIELSDPSAGRFCRRDGTTTPGIIRANGNQLTWHLRNTNTSGPADTTLTYGLTTDTPIAGDWDRR